MLELNWREPADYLLDWLERAVTPQAAAA